MRKNRITPVAAADIDDICLALIQISQMVIDLPQIVTLEMNPVFADDKRVVVSPDHSDWVYRLNEKCTFTVRVLKAQNLLPDVKIDYELGPEMYPTEVKKDMVLKDGTLKLQGTMKTAGFLRCKVKAHVDGRTYEGLATSAYAPEQSQPGDETSCRRIIGPRPWKRRARLR